MNPKQTGLKPELLISLHSINPDPTVAQRFSTFLHVTREFPQEEKNPEYQTCFCFSPVLHHFLPTTTSSDHVVPQLWAADGEELATAPLVLHLFSFDVQIRSKDGRCCPELVKFSSRWYLKKHSRFLKQTQVPLTLWNHIAAAADGR